MKAATLVKIFIYTAIVMLALAAVALVLLSPAEFVKNKVVYGGF